MKYVIEQRHASVWLLRLMVLTFLPSQFKKHWTIFPKAPCSSYHETNIHIYGNLSPTNAKVFHFSFQTTIYVTRLNYRECISTKTLGTLVQLTLQIDSSVPSFQKYCMFIFLTRSLYVPRETVVVRWLKNYNGRKSTLNLIQNKWET